MPTDSLPRDSGDSPDPDGRAAPADDARQPGELSPGRRRAFTVAMLLLPVAFFLVLEGGLRLVGYGADYPLFVEVEGADDLLMPSRDVAKRYFTQQASVPTPNPDFFPAEKGEGTFRIVAQGGSSAAGYPFYRGASFPQVLGTRLRLAYPDREVEVVNTAMAAVNSYTLLDFADEILEVQPDAVVIYAGHNEFYGALGAASTESFGRNPSVVRTYLALRGWRTVQLVRSVASWVAGLFAEREAGERPSSTLMARMIGEQSVPLGGEIYTAGLRQFESNLEKLLARYAEAGVPVYISTLASNIRDQRPFITETEGSPEWQAAAQAGIDSLQAGNARAAIPLLQRAIALDSTAADPHFALGRSYLLLGDADNARQSLERARDLDALRFRAPTDFNRIIREVAARHGATVVDGEQALRDASPGGLIGRRMMLEHLHPTLDGYSVLADAFYGAMAQDALLGPAPRSTPPGALIRLVTPMDSLAGLVRVDQLTRSWPFRPEEAQPLVLDSARTPPYVLDFARAAINGASWLPTADSLARVYERDGRLRDALVTRRALVQAYPFVPEVWSSLASLELRRAQAVGDNARVPYIAGLYEQALERDPTNTQALSTLGALALQAGDFAAATSYLERARQSAPREPQVLYNLSGAYMRSGRMDEAIATAEQLLALAPQNPQYRALLDGLRNEASGG